MSKQTWVFVEDMADAGKSFSDSLSNNNLGLKVVPVLPTDAREGLLTGRMLADGVLMDIDLSAIKGEHGTGLGIAQDIRAKQRSQKIKDFPIIRFAAREPVAKNVGGDPTSEDLFDFRIDKSETKNRLSSVQTDLLGTREVYDRIAEHKDLNEEAIGAILGLSPEKLELWSHPALHSRLADGRISAVHVAAGTFMRGLLQIAGPLINEELLAVRLGIDRARSGVAWELLLEKLAVFRFAGAGGEAFPRWWSRGLDAWWLALFRGTSTLVSLTISERIEHLASGLNLDGLVALTMPKGSAGERPWRLCSLALEADEPEAVAIDPSASVRLTPRVDLPPWADPIYASLGNTLRATGDKRLNKLDINRLTSKYR